MSEPGKVKTSEYISSITLDETSLTSRTEVLAHERHVAIADITQWNHFAVKETPGPYQVTLGATDGRIQLTVTAASLKKPMAITIPLAPFRSVIKDYFLICESYFEAIRAGNMPRIEAIDMSRRGLHNEGSELLTTLLADKVTMDSETSRRLFTLLTVLHLK